MALADRDREDFWFIAALEGAKRQYSINTFQLEGVAENDRFAVRTGEHWSDAAWAEPIVC
jgi:hypothetical protein